ncbi:hypothetical protein ILUMI_00338 [Ignelater luminosus]|uniref:Uncharacterized protein n=1 Tax=Ignelater luminosus TaxID=2038154 RepID=A0A8K0GLB7_IGNLU|nr:hypothetical protein ILUMI_00338 [Ignelater luminosus]
MTVILPNKPKSIKVHRGVYCLFHLILALFFIICIIELRSNVVEITSTFKKVFPELEIQPSISESPKTVLIRYDEGDVTTVDRWIGLIDNFLDEYRTKSETRNVATLCDFKHPPKKGQSCPIDLDNFGPCSPPFYGYYSFSPCVFLRLSEIYNWIPEYYNTTDRLPPSMPIDLIREIKLSNNKNESNQIWISCAGEHDVDKESIEAFNYYPERGFPSYYFPRAHRNNRFLSPLIAVEIVNPKPGYIVSIECRIWSKNLPYKRNNSGERQGSIRFGIMRDELVYEEG